MKEQTESMQPKELRDARAKFGLSGTEFAELIELQSGYRQVVRWEAGEARIPGSVAVLVNILETCPDARRKLGLRLAHETK